MKSIKNFFVLTAIILLTCIEMLWLFLTAVFRKKLWNKILKKGDRYKVIKKEEAIPGFDKTYTISITNKSKKKPDIELGDKKDQRTYITLFGANQFLLKPRFGLPDNIEVEVHESSYDELMFDTLTRPFIISGFRFTSTVNIQNDEVLRIEKRDGNGNRSSYPLNLTDYFSAFQFQPLIREVYPFNITFTGHTQISLPVHPESQTHITLFIKKQVSLEKSLDSIEPVSSKPSFVSRQSLTLSPATINIWKSIAEIWNKKISCKKDKWINS